MWGNKVKIRELTKNRKVACRSGLGNPSLIPVTEIATLAPAIYIYKKKERVLTLSYSCS